MANPPRTSVSSPETAKKAAPRASGLDPDARTRAVAKELKGAGGGGYRDVYANLTQAEKDRRIAEYYERVKGNKYKVVYGSDAFIQLMRKRRINPPSAGCRPTFSIYAPTDGKMPISRNAQGDWLCYKSLDSAITFRERKYQNQENDFRVFIEGAEVTPYVEGSISWTIESTGGVNTCRFVLNNTQDAFIITPTNVCAGPYNLGGWRLPYLRVGRSKQLHVYKGINRNTWRVDEVAKWQIYKQKYEAVNPDKEKKQIDSFTGMWLYPLNPFSCIFNKHDAVRVFVRLPHVTAQHKPRTTSWYDLWMPAFTGFIDKYSWSDSPVDGKRTVSITCYDYRGLMERMRVRVYSLRVTDSGGTNKPNTNAQNRGKNGTGKANDEKNTPSHINRNYLKKAIKLGEYFETKLGQIFLNAKSTQLYANTANPYDYGAKGFFLENTYIDLHTLWFLKESGSTNNGRGCYGTKGSYDIRRGHLTKKESYNSKCTSPIVAGVDATVSTIATDITKALGHLLETIMVIFDLTGDAYVIRADATAIAEAVGNQPGKSLRVITLKLIPIQQLDKNIVNSTIAKKQSVEALALKAIDKIEKKRTPVNIDVSQFAGVPVAVEVGTGLENSSTKTLVKEAAIIYAAARYYEFGVGKEIQTADSSKRTRVQISQQQGWAEWVVYAVKNNIIKLTTAEATSLATMTLNAVISKYYTVLSGYESDVESTLTSTTNRIMVGRSKLGDIGPLFVNSAESINKKIAKAKEDLKKVIIKLNAAETLSTKEAARVAKSLRETGDSLKNRIDELTRQKNAPVGSASRTTWVNLLDYEKYQLVLGITTSVSSVPRYTNSEIVTVKPGIDATSKMQSYITVALNEWVGSYRQLHKNAGALATRMGEFGQRQVRSKNKSAPRGTYKEYVKSTENARVGVNIADALNWINWKREQLKKGVKGGSSASTLLNARRFIESLREQTEAGQAQLKAKQTIADALLKFAHFEKRHAGIFADLVTAVGLQPHPLMGKSLEQSIKYLCCEQQRIFPGVVMSVNTYKDGGGPYSGKSKPNNSKNANDKKNTNKGRKKQDEPHSWASTILDAWNRTVLFGVVGRPLTYPEVTIAGQGTTSDFRSAFCPLNVFYHLLKPGDGTGASTLIQINTGTTTMNSLNVSYETRKKLLDDICSVLDYQYWVSGWGDIIFEMPHYNSFPEDFGNIVKQAYTLNTDWTNATISEESQDIPTAWVINGQHIDKSNRPTDGGKLVSNFFKTVVIMAPILARRLGVRVENINLKIPGLGGAGDVKGIPGSNKPGKSIGTLTVKQAQDQLNVYGYFHIQRQLGRAHSLQVGMPFRPYVVPNRPIWFVPRQRIGLVKSVTHTMNPPNGTCTTETNLAYTRWLFRDGTFRFVAGGPRQPISYMSFFTGIPPRKSPKEGTSDESTRATQRNNTGAGCSSNLQQKAQQASAFSSAVAAQWGVAYSTPIKIVRPSLPALATVDLPSGGLRQASSTTLSTPTDVTLTQATKGSGKPLDYMNSVWAELPGRRSNGFQGFGYLRFWANRGGSNVYKDPNVERRGSSSKDATHSGWDIPTNVGTPCKTPVDVLSASIGLEAGPWRFHSGKTVWARIGGKGDRSENTLKYFRVGDVPQKKHGFMKIYAIPYVIYVSLGGSKSEIRLGRGNTVGLYLRINGYTSVPNLQNGGRLKTQLDYLHLSDIVRVPSGKKDPSGKPIMVPIGSSGANGANSNEQKPLVTAGQVICYAGETGNGGAHLHLTMKILNRAEGGGASEQQLRTTIAANKEFIDTQLRARAAFYKYNGVDPRDDLSKVTKAADYWQKYKQKIKGGNYAKPLTVDDVVKYYQRRSTYKKFVPELVGAGQRWIYVHAGFFFTSPQIIDGRHSQLQKRSERYGRFRSIASQAESSSSKYQTQYRSLCMDASLRAINRLSTDFVKCAIKYPQNTQRSRYFRTKCELDVKKQVKAVERARGVLSTRSTTSIKYKYAVKVVQRTAKEIEAYYERGIRSLTKRRSREQVNSLTRTNANFVETK